MNVNFRSSRCGTLAVAACVAASWLLTGPAWGGGFESGQAAFDAKDYARAFADWSAAAEQGDARAQYHLGILYERGLGTEKSIPEAFEWARRAATNGEPNAQFALGALYARGGEVDKDPAEAERWFKMGVASAQGGDATAQYLLAKMYESGTGIEQDGAAALKWLRAAAEQGNADAESELGERYVRGRGVERDDAAAREWLGKAAAQGQMRAARELIPLLDHDFVAARDDASAAEALRAAAALGDSRSQYLLGMAYWFARGVARDPLQAYTWFLIAETRREELEARLGNFQDTLTPDQVRKAEKTADAWKQAHPKPAPSVVTDIVPITRVRP